MKIIAPRGHLRMVAVAAAALVVPLAVVGVVGTGASGERRGSDAVATQSEDAAGAPAQPAGAPAQAAEPGALHRGPRCWTRPGARWCHPSAEAPTTTTAAPAAGAQGANGQAAPAARAHGYRPGAYPNPATTGVPDGWQPASTHDGDLTVTTPGTVIENMLITGDLQVRANNVTVRRTRVMGIIWDQYDDNEQFSGLLIEDTEVGPDTGVLDWGNGAVGTAGFTARRVEIHNVTDGFRVSGDNIVIEDSFVKLSVRPGECNHLDAVQGYGGGTNVVITHNTFDARGSCGNSAVFFADSSPQADVEDNIMLGGAYSLRLQQAEVPGTFIAIDNRIVQNSYDNGPVYIFDSGALNLTCSGNQVVTIDDNYQISGVVGDAPCNRSH
jgi:hypothetical protein